MRHLTTGTLALAGFVAGGLVVRRRRGRAAEGDPDRLAMRPHRSDAACRHGVLSGGAGLREPDQLEGRRRRLQGRHQRARQQLPGAAGDRGIRAPQAAGHRLHADLGHAAGRGAESAAGEGPHSRHVAGLRFRRRGERREVSVSVPAGRDLLVAGRRRHPVRQGQAGRQPEGQEDRLSLLRQSGGPRAAADPQGAAAERGLRAAHLRRAAARRGDERADPRHRAALPARLRARASVRPCAVGDDQGPEELGLSAEQGAGLRLGVVGGRHRGGRRLGAWRRATTRCSSSASATTIR